MAASALCWSRSERVGEDLFSARAGSESRLKRQRKKTVTWPMDHKICEVRHFVDDDAPSSLGAAIHENVYCIQGSNHGAKQYYNSVGVKRARVEQDDIPPVFGYTSVGFKPAQPNSDSEATMMATVQWKQPSMFLLNASWLWAGGEESMEIPSQLERERRVLEAFYPRPAPIPDSSLEPLDLDDTGAIHVPVVPLEEAMIDEDMEQQQDIYIENGDSGIKSPHASVGLSIDHHSASVAQVRESSVGATDSNVAAAAAVACMLVKALRDSDLVDERLLLEILKNPSLLQTLANSKNLMGIKSQGHGKHLLTCGQIAFKELENSKLNYEASLNGSTVRHWDDSERMDLILNKSISTPHNVNLKSMNRGPVHSTLLPTINACSSSESIMDEMQCNRLHKQTLENHVSNPSSVDLVGSTMLPTTYTCSDSESSMDAMQCTRATKQNPENSISNPTRYGSSNEAPATRDRKPTNVLGSKHETDIDYHMQTPMAFRFHPTPMPTNDLLVTQTRLPRHATNATPRTTNMSRSSKGGSKFGRLCMFFSSPRGCRNGDNCTFVHQSQNFSVTTMAQLSALSNGSISL